jgi:hypothetical protein
MCAVRSARAGDICVLLIPEKEELVELRRSQEALAQTFSGWVSPEVTIACQRFDPLDKQSVEEVVMRLRTSLSRQPAFPVYARGLTQFLAPFWQAYVLRWEVEQTDPFNRFIQELDAALVENGLEPHYPHDTPFTCSGIDLITPVKIEYAPKESYPKLLFNARRVVFSKVLGLNDFETLGTVKLKD